MLSCPFWCLLYKTPSKWLDGRRISIYTLGYNVHTLQSPHFSILPPLKCSETLSLSWTRHISLAPTHPPSYVSHWPGHTTVSFGDFSHATLLSLLFIGHSISQFIPSVSQALLRWLNSQFRFSWCSFMSTFSESLLSLPAHFSFYSYCFHSM